MTTSTGNFRVVIVGGGVAGLEVALALAELAPKHVDVNLIAPNHEFVYRPMTVREPFSYSLARRYPLEQIVSAAGARLLREELDWIDRDAHITYTSLDGRIPTERPFKGAEAPRPLASGSCGVAHG